MLREDAHRVVEIVRHRGDSLGVLFLANRLPSERVRAQERDERQRARDQDAVVEGVLDERRILVERGAQRAFARHEHDDEFGRAVGLRVSPPSEQDHVIAQELRMLAKERVTRILASRLE